MIRIKSNSIVSIQEKNQLANTAQKMKFSIKNFFSKCEQICSFLRIWSHLLKKSFMENFIFCAVKITELRNLATIDKFGEVSSAIAENMTSSFSHQDKLNNCSKRLEKARNHCGSV